jgi:CubicO group peptidase (beta-lactamase class C family)
MERSFGKKDLAGPMLPSAFRHRPHAILVGSISKPVTATTLMIFAERGAIDLDRPMNDYLGQQKFVARIGDVSDATVRRVADHTAGLPMHAHWFYEDESVPHPPMDETIRRYGILVTPPGESFNYSNLNYGLIEYAIERVSGKSYADVLRDEVFVPLGLTESSVKLTPDLDDRGAIRYWGDHVVPFYDFDARGAGAVFMSAHDLVRFGMFHLQGGLDGAQKAVLRPSTINSMRNATLLNNGEKNDEYGIGWEMGERRGLKWFGMAVAWPA